MPKLVVLTGLPGSGKTKWALDQMRKSGNIVRVNRDELRAMLHGDAKWSGDREKITVAAEMSIVRENLIAGRNVIVDDTNVLGAGTSKWEQFVANGDGFRSTTSITVMDLMERTSIEQCIERDASREGKARVGRGVIERMALFGGLIDLSQLEKVAVIDVDGTLSNLDHRLHFIQTTPKDYDGFFGGVSGDGIFQTIWDAVWKLKDAGHTVIILSGRPTSTGYDTNCWLSGLEPDRLFMRQTGDHRPDDQVKRQIMERMFTAGLRKEAIKVVIDDRDSVCAVWRELELPLIQVDHGRIIHVEASAMQMAEYLPIPIKWSNDEPCCYGDPYPTDGIGDVGHAPECRIWKESKIK